MKKTHNQQRSCVRPAIRFRAISIPLAALLMLSPGLPHAGTLTTSEQKTATQLASEVSWESAQASQGQHSSRNLSSHPLSIQTLSVERQEQKDKLASPLVRVYQYHYGTASSRLLVFDLENSRLMQEKSIPSVHLPLNTSEIEFAAKLVQLRPDIIIKLQSEQIRRGEIPFVNFEDLDVKASIYEPMGEAHPCASERCALMSLFDQTRTVFATEPVVRLQSLNVELLDRQ